MTISSIFVPLAETSASAAALNSRMLARDANQEVKRSQLAISLWQEAQSSQGTVVEAYLYGRGIALPPPPTLRYHPSLRHPDGGYWPCMVALVQRSDRRPIGIHRTFITQDGSTKAPISPNKLMLGPCRGSAVRFSPVSEKLLVGEGIETCLSVMQSTGLPAWSALSASGLRSLELPVNVREVIVLADGDDPGEQAAQAAALRWIREGRVVRIARPPRGMDFNDLLVRQAAGDLP